MRRLVALGSAVLVLSATLAASALVWAEPLPSAKPEQVGLASERLDRIGQALRAEIEKGKLPGAIALVARKGRVAYFEAFGSRDKAAGAPMTKDAIFRIYSMTKPLVSVAAMIVMEDGRLVLTDPVSRFLPQLTKLQVSVPRADSTFARVTYTLVPSEREPTIQDLLRHTSGLVYGEITQNAPVKEAYAKAGVFQPAGLPYDARGVTPAEEVEGLGKAPLAHQPGTVWEYSLASDVLGRVIEAASGMRLAEFLDKRLFGPLKMVDSGFWVPKEKMDRLAQPAPDNPIRVIDVSATPKNDSGGAGGVSTTMDYARFCQMLLNSGKLDGARVLSRSTVALMTSDHLARISTPVTPGELLLGTPGYTFGLGFAVRQGPGVAGVPGSQGEFMWAGFAGTYFWVDPKEELLGVLMTQAPSPERAFYRRLFKQLVYQAIAD
ncbi:MAG: serine hydrolase [Candidatus Rokuibacteriota bacterium]|nr:MAG: serine hydrolase [Candidatus Rokubacteria bacterium]